MYPCNQCDYSATQAGNRKMHIKSIHENVKFPCNQCDYNATRVGNLILNI